MKEAARAAVDEQAPGNLDLDHRNVFPGAGGQPKPVQCQVLYRWVDRSRAHFLDEIDNSVETLTGNADDIAGTVFDAEHEHAATAVCECRQPIGESISAGTGNFVTRETNFPEFQKRTLPEANLVEQLPRAIKHA